ncbi:hypothetical protein D7B24_001476 [Verticillium nonalfalfae]|uniref:CFEM domain-containing protein n=1 Tax=Verticillium nonalfalfae TaxID=1051616 RepID=A0A3M9YGP7_9PEZI|nr:uncharacterized protein D7B24_001476 [Verticillium nonalfalfae]RNJ59753.1 hypothetical protein D7B24_001476 [Verticillium nonalfalfae]
MAQAAPPSTTIIPFANLPACALNCGVLYDANGGCVPPASGNSVDNNCFCDFAPLQPFKQGSVSGPCDAAGCAAADLTSIQSWYTSYCTAALGDSQPTVTTPTGTGTGTGTAASSTSTGGSSAGSSGSSSSGGGGDWISNHWRWVIAIVILIVGIAGIWIGACIWRRRYLKRKDRSNQFGKHTSATAFPAHGGSSAHVPGPGATEAQSGPGMFMPSAAPGPYEEKPKKEKKKWIVNQRT